MRSLPASVNGDLTLFLIEFEIALRLQQLLELLLAVAVGEIFDNLAVLHNQPLHQLVEGIVQFGAVFDRTRDDQWGARFVDQD